MKGRLCARLCPLYFKIMCASICSFACFSYFTKVVTPIASGFIHHRFVSHSLLFSSIISLLSGVCIRPPAIFLFFIFFLNESPEEAAPPSAGFRCCKGANAAESCVRPCDPLVRANASVRESAHFLSFDALLGTYNSSRSRVTMESAWGSIRPGASTTFASGESSSACPASMSQLLSSTPISPYLHRFNVLCFHLFQAWRPMA